MGCQSTRRSQAQLARQAVTGTIEVPGATLFYRSIGEGAPLLVIHGGPTLDHSYLSDHLDGLSAEGRQVIYYDQRACGQTILHQDTAGMSLLAFVQDIEALREALGIAQWDVLGHSWGGLLAQAYVIRHPDRVKHVVFVSSMAPDASSWLAAQAVEAKRITAQDSTEALAIRRTKAFSVGDHEAVEALMRIGFRSQLANPDHLGRLRITLPQDVFSRSRLFGQLAPDLAGFDFRYDLERVTVPALVIYGDQEVAATTGGPALAEHLPNARWEVVPNCGHFVFLEQPAIFQALVSDFLGR